MFSKILIANRGEIACRIIRTAKKLGIATVAVYSEADSHALHVRLADEAYAIGPPPTQQSYLRMDAIINAALAAGAQAIHPGYGFLAENAQFADACAAAGLCFIGPPASAIRAMGEKHTAKRLMQEAGVPVIPGYHGAQQDLDTLQREADAIGYPLLIKAVAGGGGKGMRVAHNHAEFAAALATARSEAKASFGNDVVLLEKYLAQPRHVEVQVFADAHGHTLFLFERDCSLQRRHQKIIEEAPAPGMDEALRNAMGTAAVNAARAIDYRGAGTIEFLLEPDGKFYFMEMNTRLQVEHPVTELITGLDLVEWQLRIAANEPLPITQQEQLTLRGHAIEARICAEDPNKDFMPSVGAIRYLRTPEQTALVRIDTGVTQGDAISIYYDPLIAKLIAWGETRADAITHLEEALAAFHVIGVHTNIALLSTILRHAPFRAQQLDTHYISRHHASLFTTDSTAHLQAAALAAIASFLLHQAALQPLAQTSGDSQSPWFAGDCFRLNLPPQYRLQLNNAEHSYTITADVHNGVLSQLHSNDAIHTITAAQLDADQLTVTMDGQRLNAHVVQNATQLHVFLHGQHWVFTTHADSADTSEGVASNRVLAPMPGAVTEVYVSQGDKVTKGDRLLVIEAMKMQHTLFAASDGVVKEIFYRNGDLIDEGVELLSWE